MVSEGYDYVNLTQLANKYSLDIAGWRANTTTKTILRHLNDLDMNPGYLIGKETLLRIELLPMIVVPEFMSVETPTPPDDLERILIDYKLGKARELMCDNDEYYIGYSDPKSDVDAKIRNAKNDYQRSKNRLDAITSTYEGVHDYLKKSPAEFSPIDQEKVYEALLEIKTIVPEIQTLITKIPEVSRDGGFGYTLFGSRRIVKALRKRGGEMKTILTEMNDILTAIKYETVLNSSQYRLLLAMAMLYESNHRWELRAMAQACRELTVLTKGWRISSSIH